MPQVASMGAAVSVVDVDRDGLADLYVTDSEEGIAEPAVSATAATARSRTSPSGSASPISTAPSTGVSMGAVWGDYDNDGFEDLFLYRWGRPELFHNDGGQRLHARHRARPACRRGRTSTPRSGSTSIATAGSISSSAATTPSRSTSGSSPTRA